MSTNLSQSAPNELEELRARIEALEKQLAEKQPRIVMPRLSSEESGAGAVDVDLAESAR